MRASAAMRTASAVSSERSPHGFSQRSGSPARASTVTSSRWRSVGAATIAASASPTSRRSSTCAKVRIPRAASSSRTRSTGSTTPAVCTLRASAIAFRCARPIRPAPIRPTRTGRSLTTPRSLARCLAPFHNLDSTSAWWYVRAAMRFGVVLEAFVDRTLDDTLELLASVVPQVTAIEVGVGGFAPAPHCDAARLLRDDTARREWSSRIEDRGFAVSALNVWGNPVDPDTAAAHRHDEELRNAVRLAAALGVDRVIAMAGCPAGAPGDHTPHFDAGGWLPYLAGIGERQWAEVVAPYWQEVADFARREHPGLLICIELHPGTCVHNAETFERLPAIPP